MGNPQKMAQKLWDHIGLPKQIQDVLSVSKALLTGEHVSEERLEARIKICATCPLMVKDGKDLKCGICGCNVKGSRKLINLLRYEETDSYGCKAPEGSKWKEAGV